VWPLAAFGGRSVATATAFGLTCVISALVLQPRIHLQSGLDRTLLVLLALLAIESAPLPQPLVSVLSPHADDVRNALTVTPGQTAGWLPLSIDAPSTLWAWAVMVGAVALFWMARAQFKRGGVRLTARFVAMLGFAVSMLAIAQAATAGRKIYWRFETEFEGPLPFGPFINRNHFATWIVMALPLCLGYLAARSGSRPDESGHRATRSRLAHAIDPRTAWLMTACATMVLALLLSLSRSGALALGVSAALTIALCRRHLDRRRRRGLLIAAGVIGVLGLAWADIPALRERVAGAQAGLANRVTIWRETMPVVRAFWLTGTGAGTYQQAMFVYQRSGRTVYFNQAHNHYLQVAAEGGVLIVAAVGLAIAVFLHAARRRLAGGPAGLLWIRIGAACGLTAVALQSLWETGLVMPANAAMAALLAAVLVHDRPDP
jgi:hypothetical protein